jgi:hypothetical protein
MKNSLLTFLCNCIYWRIFHFFILRFFLIKPVYHWTVAGVPLVVSVPQFDKSWSRRSQSLSSPPWKLKKSQTLKFIFFSLGRQITFYTHTEEHLRLYALNNQQCSGKNQSSNTANTKARQKSWSFMVSWKRTLDDGEMLTDLDKILYHLWLISNLESRPLALVIVGANITENFKTMKCSKITY